MSKYRFPVKSIKETLAAFAATPSNERVVVHGWVRTVRTQKQLAFCSQGVQAVVTDPGLVKRISTGASVRLEGALVKYITEIIKKEEEKRGGFDCCYGLDLLFLCRIQKYPLHKAKLPLEHLRDNFHLRTRTRTFTAIWKLRNATMQGFHNFFQVRERSSSNDCEGAGESFRVLSSESLASYSNPPLPPSKNLNNHHHHHHTSKQQQQPPFEFFNSPSNLTVSSQLHLEALNAALPRLSTRHLAEFWMLEAEAAFITDLDQLLDLIEASIKSTTDFVESTCTDDLHAMLKSTAKPFERITYTEALGILQRVNRSWVHPVDKWGVSLQSEHERFLAEEYFKKPVFVTDYPAQVKPFYMLDSVKQESLEGTTVACVDLLVPGIGEVVGGSLREHSLEGIERKIKEKGLGLEGLEWYLDLRRFGSVPHGGFGLGVERYLMAISGMANVKDVVPMPRWFGHCQY
ncbi:hypothetical protein BDR26DRAFT_909022 [Obelidium mucronatum]|nr:hypothetical protein BDR26DRAFT_909022 [Obelidium mucronatum]